MRNFTLSILLILLVNAAQAQYADAQYMSITDLTSITGIPEKKVDKYLERLGFDYDNSDRIQDTAIRNYRFARRKKKDLDDTTERQVSRFQLAATRGITYQTTSEDEAYGIEQEILMSGFRTPLQRKEGMPVRYQAKDLNILYTTERVNDSVTNFKFKVTRKFLPTAAEIYYAEDLLVFQSHEQLRYIYGDRNVKKDFYYFTSDNPTPCTVLFPNTNQQAIFLWDDVDNYYQLSFILIGGGLQVESSFGFNEAIGHNTWRLKNGLRTGMSLQELKMANGNDFSFYGSKSEFSGIIVPEPNGNIDFKTTGFKLNCLNCADAVVLNNEKVSAEKAIADNRRLYVNAIILHPTN